MDEVDGPLLHSFDHGRGHKVAVGEVLAQIGMMGGGKKEATQWGRDGDGCGACSARVGDVRGWQVVVIKWWGHWHVCLAMAEGTRSWGTWPICLAEVEDVSQG